MAYHRIGGCRMVGHAYCQQRDFERVLVFKFLLEYTRSSASTFSLIMNHDVKHA